jgi:hypothetical protein
MKPVQLPAFVKKKSFVAAVVLGTLLFGVPATLAEEPLMVGVKSDYSIWSNGEKLQMSEQAVVIGDKVYVPLRSIGEALGKQVDWNDREGMITVKDSSSFQNSYVWTNLEVVGTSLK